MTASNKTELSSEPESAQMLQSAAPPRFLSVSEQSKFQTRPYRIEVKSRGCHVAEYVVEATDALKAINLVESYYGDPVTMEHAVVETEDGRKRQIMIAENWHGYTFDARVVES